MNTSGIYYDETHLTNALTILYSQRHIPGANGRGANFVATEDAVYVATGSQCIVLDAATGAIVRTIQMPAGPGQSAAPGKDLEPIYEKEAKTVRVRLINESMIGKVVRIEGVVERVHFQFLNRPQYTVADRSGSISVKMFTSPEYDVKVNDIVEVYGQVIRRYMVTGEPVINCVIIRKYRKPAE